MHIHLIAVGERMPAWVQAGVEEYRKRLPRELQLVVQEIPAGRRGKNSDLRRLIREESTRLLAAVPRGALPIALAVEGRAWRTEQLAGELEGWLGGGRDVALLVGGPDGIDAPTLQQVPTRWSLGPLTLPHPLVRIIVAEQIYRAWSLLRGHPYHRA